MSTANQTQVGGTHYKNAFQHWDLADELDLGYYEGQISKYTTRHRFKKGKQDADKLRHFCIKLIELVTHKGRQPRHRPTTFARMTQYAEANHLLPIEYACIMSICNWQSVEDLRMLLTRIDRLIAEVYPASPYAEQDRVWNKLGGLPEAQP